MKGTVWQLGVGTLLLTFGISPNGVGPMTVLAEPNAVTFPGVQTPLATQSWPCPKKLT